MSKTTTQVIERWNALLDKPHAEWGDEEWAEYDLQMKMAELTDSSVGDMEDKDV